MLSRNSIPCRFLMVCLGLAASGWLHAAVVDAADTPPSIGPLPAVEAPPAELVELGKLLFFDVRLSGDVTLSCASCHDPNKGWADGIPLSLAYPGTLYFRNTKTVLNAAHARYLYWDGRLTGGDMPTQVRDSITESHFLNMDGRIMLERLKQVPEYVRRFNKALGSEPSFGGTLKAISAFEKTLVSRNVPFDNGKLSAAAQRGREIFEGKGRCVQCHNGPMFSDYLAHKTGVPVNREVLADPLRHLTLRSFSKFMGVPGFENLKEDVGHFVVTKEPHDRGSFVTPTLRELTRTAPYMHNGMLATLEDVVDFYAAGAGNVAGKDPLLRSFELGGGEKSDLVEFLAALSGDEISAAKVKPPPYALIENWRSVPN